MKLNNALLLIIFVLSAQACVFVQTIQPSNSTDTPKILLPRLKVTYLGLTEQSYVGTGCPGEDNLVKVDNLHFQVSGVDEQKLLQQIVVTGDNSTLTWELLCDDAWRLEARPAANGVWNIYIAKSEPATVYTVLFIYDDNTIALGNTYIP